MSDKEQFELRLRIINVAISVYKTMPHDPFMSKADMENILSALNTWKEETELFLLKFE